ncbi:MAG: hypothetical protein LBE31_09460 [Deltaproteobacteria bacterium]|jgi:cell division protein FtsB|nr:hypothetical protein [Deltaproteobacteria bacterium]
MSQKPHGPVINRPVTTVSQRAANPGWKKTQAKIKSQRAEAKAASSILTGDTNQPLEPTERLERIPPRAFAILAAILVVLILGLWFKTTLAMRHNQLGREVSRLTDEKVELNELNRELKAEMARLTVLEDLEFIAIESLGLVSPKDGQIEIIE